MSIHLIQNAIILTMMEPDEVLSKGIFLKEERLERLAKSPQKISHW
ncbi:hypothetical protein [Shimazuella alba]|nr:hypothetical protein [Shimazuella alba]